MFYCFIVFFFLFKSVSLLWVVKHFNWAVTGKQLKYAKIHSLLKQNSNQSQRFVSFLIKTKASKMWFPKCRVKKVCNMLLFIWVHCNLYLSSLFQFVLLTFLSDFLLSGLVHSECIVISLPSIWGHCSNGSEPALSYHRGTLPGRCTAVLFRLPHSSQTHPRKCTTGCLCKCNTLITQTTNYNPSTILPDIKL